jgi:predicted RNA-binding protein associated with RNAse of E/G family
VEIHYLRPPGRITIFRQRLVQQADGCTITLMERTPLPRPVLAAGQIILEPDAPAVWLTFADSWHDIGLFHDATHRFTGWYANILTPVRFRAPLVWETTDLFLDIWLGAAGDAVLLDEDELDSALDRGWLDPAVAVSARAEADRLLEEAAAGKWPPAIAREWTLQRAQETIAAYDGTRSRNEV